MANKRIIKKSINLLTSELLNECFAYSYYHPPKQVTETMWALAHTRNELISRVNRKIPKDSQDKQYIRSFYKSLKKDISEMPDLMNHFTG